jgi:hypothetical protein
MIPKACNHYIQKKLKKKHKQELKPNLKILKKRIEEKLKIQQTPNKI